MSPWIGNLMNPFVAMKSLQPSILARASHFVEGHLKIHYHLTLPEHSILEHYNGEHKVAGNRKG